MLNFLSVSMSKVLQRGTAIVAVIASLVFATAALGQMPTSPWKKAAPFSAPTTCTTVPTAVSKVPTTCAEHPGLERAWPRRDQTSPPLSRPHRA
jgi:hypothetical protein